MKNEKFYCPKCNHQIYISHNIDWHSLYIYYYPVCPHCGWSSKQVFDSPDEVKEFMKEGS